MAYPKIDSEIRFLRRVAKGDDCWEWTGSKTRGYGRFALDASTTVSAHRWSYERFIGPIPQGLTIDHLCRNRSCVNPHHMEPVTREENLRRRWRIRTECDQGHAYSPENTSTDSKGIRCCLECRRARGRRNDAKRQPRTANARSGDE